MANIVNISHITKDVAEDIDYIDNPKYNFFKYQPKYDDSNWYQASLTIDEKKLEDDSEYKKAVIKFSKKALATGSGVVFAPIFLEIECKSPKQLLPEDKCNADLQHCREVFPGCDGLKAFYTSMTTYSKLE